MRRRKRTLDIDFSQIPEISTTSAKEWAQIERAYVDAISEIQVPYDLDANDILRINSLVDQVYSQARFDHAHAKKMLKHYERRLSNAKKTLRLTFVKQKGQTAADNDALITQFLETSPIKPDTEPLYTLIDRWEEREIFMDAVIDNLLKITDKMVNGNGALKLNAQGRGDVR